MKDAMRISCDEQISNSKNVATRSEILGVLLQPIALDIFTLWSNPK